MQPRIYTYKVTFEEIPDWYWGAHKERKYGEPYLGSPKTHKWKWEFYTPNLQICEVFPYTNEGWTQARKIEDSCILPDLNNPLCLNEHVGGLMSLEAYSKGGKISHKEKDELGRSALGVKNAEKVHKEKDEFGRSIRGVEAAERLHKEKDERGKSVNSTKRGKSSFRNKTGIHDPSYRNSPEYKAINKEAGRKGGIEGVRRKSGIHDPNYRSSETYLEMRSKVSKKMAERRVGMFDPEFKQILNQKLSKPVTFHYPDGQTVTFPSRMEAIRQTRISSSTLVRVLLKGNAIGWGRFKGVRITEGNG
jgi:hypothetical protein